MEEGNQSGELVNSVVVDMDTATLKKSMPREEERSKGAENVQWRQKIYHSRE